MAVGMAMAEKHLAARFNTEKRRIIDHYTYALCGDGCMMEGVSGEAASLAGTLELGKLIVLYDDNGISIEGDTDCAFREDVGKRFEAYGWQVLHVPDGQDLLAIGAAVECAKASPLPSLIVVRTRIGEGWPKPTGNRWARKTWRRQRRPWGGPARSLLRCRRRSTGTSRGLGRSWRRLRMPGRRNTRPGGTRTRAWRRSWT